MSAVACSRVGVRERHAPHSWTLETRGGDKERHCLGYPRPAEQGYQEGYEAGYATGWAEGLAQQARLDNHYGYCTLEPDHDGACGGGNNVLTIDPRN